MGDSLFDIFGDHHIRQAVKNVPRQPLSNIENMGKSVTSGPIKPNEPVKRNVENKKSFLSNTGKALQSTPARQVFTPRAVNVGSLIYNDGEDSEGIQFDALKFTKPKYNCDNYYSDVLDYLPSLDPKLSPIRSSPNSPLPTQKTLSMEFDCSYEDDFFTDDFSCESTPEFELDFPEMP